MENVSTEAVGQTETPDIESMNSEALQEFIKDSDQEEGTSQAEPVGESSQEAQIQPENEQIAIPKSEFEKLQNQIKEKEAFINRRNLEIGEARRRERELLEALAQIPHGEALQDKFIMNYQEAEQDLIARRNLEAELKNIQFKEYLYAEEARVKSSVPELPEYVDIIADIASRKGETPDNIQAFKQNPYATPMNILMPYLLEAKEAKLRELQSTVQTLKNKSGEVVKKIAETARGSAPILNASTGISNGAKREITSADIERMSRDQLIEFMKS